MKKRRLLGALTLVLTLGCAGAEPDGGDLGAEGTTSAKGGLDGPPVAVAPFLNGALPTRTPGSPSGAEWTTETAFPSLSLPINTILISSNPDDDRLYVGLQDGLVVTFDNRFDVATSDTFIDLRDRVATVFEGGLMGLAFHPDFGVPGSPHRNSFYVYYSSHCLLDATGQASDLGACDESYPTDPAGGFFGVYLRLSRFEVFDGTTIGDPNSEQVLINFQLRGSSHRGGGLAVREDGLLFLSIGDQGWPGNSQEIEDSFDGGVLRLAVNVDDNGDGTWVCPPGSHPPRKRLSATGEASGQFYCIPDDNPWLDPTNGIFEEYCAIGLRNPFRMSIDPVTGRVWTADVGQSTREEVDVIECGNNYGWPFREGLVAGSSSPPSSYIGVLTDPVIDFTRDEAGSIIGGYVYRGSKFPELYGRYIVGDFITNQIWAVTLDESTMTATDTLLTSFPPGNLATFGQDNQGEVFFTDIFRTGLMYQLGRQGAPSPDAPALLSQTGAFSSLPNATPSAFWVPYGLNQPFWSDGAVKHRFIALPNDGSRNTVDEKVGFSEMGDWSYPIGTVLMKHFELPLDETDPSVKARLETRFMVLGEDGAWYGVTYRWRPDRSDADLLTTEATADYVIDLADGGTRTQTWYFPSRLDCLRCHRQGSGGALGLRTHQLNGDFTYASTGRTENQLETWNDLGMFSPALSTGSIPSLIRAPSLEEVTAPLQDRARSWLDSNCGYCHRPGEVDAGFDARFTTPFASQDFLWTPVREDLGNPGTVVVYPGDPIRSAVWQRSAAVGSIAMPPLAKELAEEPAVDLLASWIERLPSSSPNTAPALVNPGAQTHVQGQVVSLSLSANDADGDALFFSGTGLPEGLSIDPDTGRITGPVSNVGNYAVTVSVSDGPAVAVVSFGWTVTDTTGAACGDGSLDPGEECDDGNAVSGDGCTANCLVEFCGDFVVNNGGTEACEPPNTATCTAVCTIRTPVCGDGFVTGPEACDDGNLANGDGCSSVCTIETPLGCGNGVLETGEQCDDGNGVDGDGCSSDCQFEETTNLAALGTIIAKVTSPIGGGNPDIEVIRDGDKPPVGYFGSERQYDTFSGGSAATEDWIGYAFPTEVTFAQIVFQEGINPADGGYFETLTAQVRRGATWSTVQNLTVTPSYAGDNGVSHETYVLDFDPTPGDAIRLYGQPGGTAFFISVAELEVYAADPVATCGDGQLDPGEACDDGNALDGDGCTTTCVLERCGDGVINDRGVEECDDGNRIDGDGCASYCRKEDRLVLSQRGGTIIARVTSPEGNGSRDLEVIRDGDLPPPGDTSPSRQYDTFSGGGGATADWIGYEFPNQEYFSQVLFQEGVELANGGFFENVTVQVRTAGVWAEPPNLRVTPVYPSANGIHYQTYLFDFDSTAGEAIRIYGTPGGSDGFISVGELIVLGPPPQGCSVRRNAAPFDPTVALALLGLVLARRRRRR